MSDQEKRDRILEAAECDLKFLDPKWDAALLGFAESGGRGRYVLPCYGYQAIKSIVRALGGPGVDLYVAMQLLYREMPKEAPLMLTKLSRRQLWPLAVREKFMRWDSLDNAVLGVGKLRYKTTGLIYSKPLCIDILAKTSTSVGDEDKILQSIKKVEEEIIPVAGVKYTPWYLTPIQ